MQITKTVNERKATFLNKKGEQHSNVSGIINVPKFFRGKSFTVTFPEISEGNEYPPEIVTTKVSVCGGGAIMCFPQRFIGRKCNIEINDSDVLEYFKVRFSDTV